MEIPADTAGVLDCATSEILSLLPERVVAHFSDLSSAHIDYIISEIIYPPRKTGGGGGGSRNRLSGQSRNWAY